LSPLCPAVLLGLFVCSRAAQVSAHDFWLQPSEYWITPDARTPMTLLVGHGPDRQRSPIPARRITRFQAIAPKGTVVDLHEQLQLGGIADDGDFRLKDPGVYVLVLQTDDRAQTHLPSIRFNDYLKIEGLTPALEQRARLNQMDRDGSERYSRCAKSIVQVGPIGAGAQGQVSRPVGMPLEIVPEANPYGVPRSPSLPVRVIYAGHPLAGALVKITDLNNDASPFEVHVTDRDGRASFTMPNSGRWLLNVIWTKVLPRSEETDFETVFSSLSFGFKDGREVMQCDRQSVCVTAR
jgi:uncharacterized GH25 family protein